MTQSIIIYCCKKVDCRRAAQEKGRSIAPFGESGWNIYKAEYQLVIGHHCDFCDCCRSTLTSSPAGPAPSS